MINRNMLKIIWLTTLGIAAATAQEVVLEDHASVAASVLPTLIGADGITQVEAAQQTGLSGHGVRVCVVDQTIDIKHPTFGDCIKAGSPPPPACRVYTSYNAATDKNELELLDGESHGTHVAGIAVGSFPFKLRDANGNPIPYQRGVAYGALLGAFSWGYATDEDALKAMNQTVVRKCDIVNMSWGAGTNLAWRDVGIADGMKAFDDHDVIAVAAGGNSGKLQGGNFMFTGSSSLGIYPNAISVAATDNTATPGSLLELSDAIDTPTGSTKTLAAIDRTDNKVTVLSPITDAFNLPQDILLFETVPADDGCTPFNSPRITRATWAGKVFVLNFKPDCPTAWNDLIVWLSIIDMKPSLVLVALPTVELTRLLSMTLADHSLSTKLNIMFMKPEDGVALAEALAAMEPGKTLKLVKLPGATVNPMPSELAGQPADYSSLGPGMDLSMKPDIAAPGTLYSSLPDGKYGTWPGTSMASPYISGVAALWVERMRRLGLPKPPGGWARAAKVALKNTAKPMAYKDTSLVYPVVKVGAGLVQAYSAVATKVSIKPAELPLSSGVASQSFSLTLTNRDKKEATFILGHKPAVGVSLSRAWYRLAFDESIPTARVAAVNSTITVPAEGSITFKVEISIPAAALKLDDAILSGYITFTPANATTEAGTADEAAAAASNDQLLSQPDLSSATPAAPAAAESNSNNLPIILSVAYQAVSGDYSTVGRPKSMAVFAKAMPELNAVGAQMLLGRPNIYICDATQLVCSYKQGTAPYKVSDIEWSGVYFAAPFIRPVRRVELKVYAANGTLLGTTLSFGGCRASGPLELGTLSYGYCDRLAYRPQDGYGGWKGRYIPVGGKNYTQAVSVEAGQTYSFKALIYGAFAVSDRIAGRKPQQQPWVIEIPNKLKVVKG